MSSLNKWMGIGRLGKDIELKKTSNGLSVTSFTIACERSYASGKDKVKESDWIDCQAWKNNADYLSKYAHKGDMIGIEGHLQKRSYTNTDKQKVYLTEVIVEKAVICPSKRHLDNGGTIEPSPIENASESKETASYENDFGSLDISSDDLPF